MTNVTHIRIAKSFFFVDYTTEERNKTALIKQKNQIKTNAMLTTAEIQRLVQLTTMNESDVLYNYGEFI